MKTTTLLLSAILTTASLLTANADTILINHTFDEGTGGLDGTSLDAGGSLSGSWTAHSTFNANGDFSLVGSDEASFNFALGGAVSTGNKYTLEIVVDLQAGTGLANRQVLNAGFKSSGNVDDSLDNQGSPWWTWKYDGSVTGSIGTTWDGLIVNGENISAAGGDETFTIELDYRDHNGTDNWGSVAIYHGATLLGEAENDANITVGGYVTFGIRSNADATTVGSLSSLTLTDITPAAVPEPSTLALLGAGGLLLWYRRKRLCTESSAISIMTQS